MRVRVKRFIDGKQKKVIVDRGAISINFFSNRRSLDLANFPLKQRKFL